MGEQIERKFILREGVGDEDVAEAVFKRRIYEEPGYKIQPGWRVVDIGAHIGAFTVFAAAKGAHVFSFEPDPRNLNILKQNTADLPAVCVGNVAIGKANETRKLWMNEHPSCSSFSARTLEQSVDVDTITLERVVTLAGERVDLLKCDAESAEYEIFPNAPRETLRKIERIVMEWHNNRDMAMWLAFVLVEAGFRVDHFSVDLSRKPGTNMLSSRGLLFLHNRHETASVGNEFIL